MTFDLIVRNATLYDGTGAAPAAGDVAISGGRIAAIGPDGRARTRSMPPAWPWRPASSTCTRMTTARC